MKISITLERIEQGLYSCKKYMSLESDILVNFLRVDVRSRALSWIDWINNPGDESGSANATVVTMDPDCPEDILIGDILDDGDLEDIPHFTIKKNNLIELLRKWDELYKQNVPYIILTIDDDHYVHIEGKSSIEEM